jgi:hypothetical protein
LIFCTSGFDRFGEYRKNIRKPSLKKIFRNHYGKKSNTIKPAKRPLKFAVAITAIVMLATLTMQLVAMSLGYDNLFEFVRNWFREDDVSVSLIERGDDGVYDLSEIRTTTVTDSTDEPSGDVTDDNSPADDVVSIDFENLEDIDEVWLERVPPVLTEQYVFAFAEYFSFQGDETFVVYFFDESENIVSLLIQNKPMLYVERDIEGLVETVVVGGVTFDIFRNIDDYHVIWECGDWLFTLNAHLPLDEVMEIVRGYY